MAAIVIKINKTFINNLEKLNDELLAAADQAIYTASIVTASNVRRKLHSGARSGRIYRRGRAGAYIYHQASAPGEPPKTDTGNLANHTYAEKVGFLESRVVSDAIYSRALEEGSAKNHLEPRPFMALTVEESKVQIQNIIDAAIKRALNR